MRRIAVAGLSLVALGGVLAITLVFLMWHEHRTTVTLPAPTGAFAIGRATFVLSKEANRSSDSPDSRSGQALMVWM
jgi:hypothetical protein